MIRSKGEAGTGNIVEAVRHLRSIIGDIRKITQADSAELFEWAKQLQAPLPLVQEIAETGWLPVPLFCAGGIATPADAALAMQLGAEAVFVGSGIFKSDDPAPRAKAIVEATTHFQRPDDPRQGQPRARRADDRHRDGRDQPALRRARLVSRCSCRRARPPGAGLRSGCSRCRARSRAHVSAPASARRRDAARSARRPSSTASTRWSCPAASRRRCRGCSTTSGLFEPIRPSARRRHAGVRHVRRDDPAGAARCSTAGPTSAASAPSTSTVRRNGYGRQVDSFEADLDVAGLDATVPRRVHPRPAGRAVGADVEVLADHDGVPVAGCARAT